jgi:homoserine dehydrogenase
MRELRVGCLGLGNVMQAFIEHYGSITGDVAQQYGFKLRVVAYCDSKRSVYDTTMDIAAVIKKKNEQNNGGTTKKPLADFRSVINNEQIDVLIDAVPGSKTDAGPTYPLLREAIKRNITVVSVNKSPLVFKGAELFSLAKKHHTPFGISGTTAGCLPSSGIIMNELAGSGVRELRGILNGTSNYVLDRIMLANVSCEQAVQEAVKLGIAEPDYAFDLDGTDTCFKMIILGLVISGQNVPLKNTRRTGIQGLTQTFIQDAVRKKCVVRLIGTLLMQNDLPVISVEPEVLNTEDPLFDVRGTGKGITIKTDYMGTLSVLGGSSGRCNIAATVLKDIINAYKTQNL